MTHTADDVVVRRQIVVRAPIDQAFIAFTERFGDFKPPEHNLLGVPISETVFEPRVGGHITDRAVGTRRVYRLNPAGMAALRDQLETFWNRALVGYQDVVEQRDEENS